MTVEGHLGALDRCRLAPDAETDGTRRAARSATAGSGAGADGFGSSPRLMRSMMAAASPQRSSIVLGPTGPRVTRFRPAGPPGLDDVEPASGGVDRNAEAGKV